MILKAAGAQPQGRSPMSEPSEPPPAHPLQLPERPRAVRFSPPSSSSSRGARDVGIIAVIRATRRPVVKGSGLGRGLPILVFILPSSSAGVTDSANLGLPFHHDVAVAVAVAIAITITVATSRARVAAAKPFLRRGTAIWDQGGLFLRGGFGFGFGVDVGLDPGRRIAEE